MRTWIFADWKLPNQSDIDLIDDLGFTDVVLGLALPKTARFTPLYGGKRVVNTIKKIYDQLDVNVHLMSWMHRESKFVWECTNYLSKLAIDTCAESILLDTEKDWHNGNIKPETVVRHGILTNPFYKAGNFELGVTGLSFLHPTVKPLLEVCDYCIPQAYSIWKPGQEDHWSHSESTEPYHQQRRSVDDWSVCNKNIILGLSNYWASRPIREVGGLSKFKIDTEESLTRAINGAMSKNVYGVAYWSLKWFKGKGKNRQIAREVFKKYFPK